MTLKIKLDEPLVEVDLGGGRTLRLTAHIVGGTPDPDPDPDPTPEPEPEPQPQPASKTHAVYYMCWSNSGSPLFVKVNAAYNEIRLAFAQSIYSAALGRKVLRLVGAGSQNVEEFKKAIAERRKKGHRVLLSIGGEHGAVDIANPENFAEDIEGIMRDQTGPLDGIDWDVEASALVKDKVMAVNRLVVAKHATWRISYAPNGNNIDQYLPVAVETYRSVTKNVAYGQQFYDAPVTWNDVTWRVNQAKAAGLPAEVILLGMMNPVAGESAEKRAKRWAVADCVAYVKNAKALGLGGAYCWEAGRDQEPGEGNASYPTAVASALGLTPAA